MGPPLQSSFMKCREDKSPMRATFAMLLAALAFSGCSVRVGGSGASGVARVGHPAPDWTVPTSRGAKLTLSSLRGKAVYLNFFATWCPPCNEEAPSINALQKQYGYRGLQVVGVDELENQKKAESFVRKFGLVYPAVVDDGTLQSQYEVNGLPVHVFIDRSGVIKKIAVGEMSTAQIAAAVRSIL
jgi:cytochrome c biogenesis protein CcmG/thiol:disulfide interchange protein DsbE